jgi:hypothetical protein
MGSREGGGRGGAWGRSGRAPGDLGICGGARGPEQMGGAAAGLRRRSGAGAENVAEGGRRLTDGDGERRGNVGDISMCISNEPPSI